MIGAMTPPTVRRLLLSRVPGMVERRSPITPGLKRHSIHRTPFSATTRGWLPTTAKCTASGPKPSRPRPIPKWNSPAGRLGPEPRCALGLRIFRRPKSGTAGIDQQVSEPAVFLHLFRLAPHNGGDCRLRPLRSLRPHRAFLAHLVTPKTAQEANDHRDNASNPILESNN